MTEILDSVNALIVRFHRASKRDNISDTKRRSFLNTAATLVAIKEEILSLQNRLAPLPSRLGDLSDLPPELLGELSAPRVDELDSQIIDVIHAYGGTADLDQILVGLFRKFKVAQKRRFLQNKVWRMAQKEMLWSIRGKKGVYTIKEPAEEEKEEIKHESSDDDFPF
jgi:hypothetical protein